MLKQFYEKHGIIRETTVPYTLEQNDIAETLKKTTNAIFISSGLLSK